MNDDDPTRKNPESESAEGETINLNDEQLKAMNGGSNFMSDDLDVDTNGDQNGPVWVAIC